MSKKSGFQRVRDWKKNNERAEKSMIDVSKDGAGHVYIFKLNSYQSLYKIGMSTDVLQRLKTLQAANPELKLIWTARVRMMRQAEKELHKHFAAYKIKREIYELLPEEIRQADTIIDYLR